MVFLDVPRCYDAATYAKPVGILKDLAMKPYSHKKKTTWRRLNQVEHREVEEDGPCFVGSAWGSDNAGFLHVFFTFRLFSACLNCV